MGAGELATTTEVKVALLPPSKLTGRRTLRVIDSPGLDQSESEDIENIKGIIKTVKETTRHVKLFPIVLNGTTRGEQLSTIETIAIFEEVFGEKFWHHACVVVTHFSNSQE